MRILLDENIPRGLRRILPGHDVRTASEMGWASIANGQLLDEAEKAGFEALVTSDQNFVFQQNLARAKHCHRRPFHQQVGNNTSPAAERPAERFHAEGGNEFGERPCCASSPLRSPTAYG